MTFAKLTLTIDRETKEKLRAIAEKDSVSLSLAVEVLIEAEYAAVFAEEK